jgi:hypothetical protein
MMYRHSTKQADVYHHYSYREVAEELRDIARKVKEAQRGPDKAVKTQAGSNGAVANGTAAKKETF